MKTLQSYKDYIEARGYTVMSIVQKGSQNYNLDSETSDIDANAVLLPNTVKELKYGIAKKFSFAQGEVVCHDLYSFSEIVIKGNPQFIEILHTPYQIGKTLDFLKHCKVNPAALKGIAYEKAKYLEKLRPSSKADIEKYGYIPKNLLHIIRLYDLLEANVPSLTYEKDSPKHRYLMSIKEGKLSLSEATTLKNEYLIKLDNLCQKRKLEYEKTPIDESTLDTLVLNNLKDRTNASRTN